MGNVLHHLFLKTSVFVILLVLLFAVQSTAQQKAQFTQYMFNGLVINPAYAGADEALSLTFIQRKQWAGIQNSPSTQSLLAHTLFKKKQTGLGFILINDKLGVHKNLNVLANYAYHLKVGEKSYLSMGVQAGLHNRKSDYASLMANSGTDPKLYNAAISNTSFDFGMGLYYRSPRLHVGISAPELIPETITLNDTLSIQLSKVNYFLFTKYLFVVNENINVEPSVLIKYLSGVPVSFDLNMNMIYRKVVTFGLSYRKSESIDFMLKGQITPQLQFGYSYDHSIGRVSNVSNGSHELMIQYIFKYVERNVTSPR
jgi:type IX secretion system PorP/SprF family membrane protein